jgi:hypothetical protein
MPHGRRGIHDREIPPVDDVRIEMRNMPMGESAHYPSGSEDESQRSYRTGYSPRRTDSLHINGWTSELENLLVTWAEKASGYAWLHNRSIALFKHRNLFLTIPASLLAYASAGVTLLAAADRESSWRTAVAGLGSLLSGMLINFQDQFTFKELSEQHRLSQLGFLAFFRDISCELSVPKIQRKEASEYVTLKRLEMDKLLEHAPDIPPRIVKAFDEQFADANIHKPDVVSRLQTVIPHLSPMPPGELAPHTMSGRRPMRLDFRPGRDLVVPMEARTDVNDLVEIANSESSSEGERDDPSVLSDAESSSSSSEQGDGHQRANRGNRSQHAVV